MWWVPVLFLIIFLIYELAIKPTSNSNKKSEDENTAADIVDEHITELEAEAAKFVARSLADCIKADKSNHIKAVDYARNECFYECIDGFELNQFNRCVKIQSESINIQSSNMLYYIFTIVNNIYTIYLYLYHFNII